METVEFLVLRNLLYNEEYVLKVFPFIKGEYFEDAMMTANDNSKPGDTVLLSPACASFDQFCNFSRNFIKPNVWFSEKSKISKKFDLTTFEFWLSTSVVHLYS